MKKPLLPIISILALATVPTLAQERGEFTFSSTAVSAYIFRGEKIGGPSFQPALEYAQGPLALGVFASFPMDKKWSDTEYPEIDFYGSYEISVVPDVFSVTSGFSVYSYPTAKKEEGWYKAYYEPYVKLGYRFHEALFSFTVYYDLTQNGAIYEVGAEYSLPVKPIGTELELSAFMGRFSLSNVEAYASPKVGKSGNYMQAGVSAPYEITEKSKITAGIYYARGCDNNYKYKHVIPAPGDPSVYTLVKAKEPNPNAVGRVFLSASYSYIF